jgi:hypothetical protein
MRLFISYETSDGLGLAEIAKSVFERAGHSAWVWHLDGTSGAYMHEEIEREIRQRDYFLYIATCSSDASEGQRYERCTALTYGKNLLIVTFDRAHVSSVFNPLKQDVIPQDDFAGWCGRKADEIWRQQSLSATVRVHAREDEPVESA